MENNVEKSECTSLADEYYTLFDNISAMLLVQGMNPKLNKQEMYITFDNKMDDAKLDEAMKEEVRIVFGDDCQKRYLLKKGKKKTTINFIVAGKWE